MGGEQETVTRKTQRPVGLREEARLVRVARIRAAAEELLEQKRFSDITTREVAQHAGIGEATLFRYMPSKRDLLILVYGHQMDALLARIEQADAVAVATAKPGRIDGNFYCDRIYAIYQARSGFYLRNPENAALYLRLGFEVGGKISRRNIAQGDRTIGLSSSIILDGQTAGFLSSTVESQLVAQNCHGIFMHEIDRTPVRGLAPESIWDRVSARLSVQLRPLITSR